MTQQFHIPNQALLKTSLDLQKNRSISKENRTILKDKPPAAEHHFGLFYFPKHSEALLALSC